MKHDQLTNDHCPTWHPDFFLDSLSADYETSYSEFAVAAFNKSIAIYKPANYNLFKMYDKYDTIKINKLWSDEGLKSIKR